MDVQIIERKTERLLDTYRVVLGGLNYEPTEQEYFSEAWRCAIEDKLVDPAQREKYVIRFP